MTEQTASESAPESKPKTPRHVVVATKHLLKQREKSVAARDKATAEITELDKALTALGWVEDASGE